MGRRNKPRRHDVYSLAFVFPDGSAFSCGPHRKPSSKRLKDDGDFVDEDFVFKEYKYGPDEWVSWSDDQRRELGQTMAIRLNTRRSIRELVLPELKIIQNSLQLITARLDSIEQSLKASGVDK